MKPTDAFSPGELERRLARLPHGARYRVAFSGGPDSHALLFALTRLSIRRLGVDELSAVHVNHGLQPQAANWARRCQQMAADLGVALDVLCVDASTRVGESPEAAARRARYSALAAQLAPGDVLLTGHTEDDQAETLLLQLLRGAGPRGLAGMPCVRKLGAGWLARPLLGVSRRALREFSKHNGLRSIRDPSNSDVRFNRNFIRHRVLSELRVRWPGVARALSRVASHQAEMAELQRDIADADLADSRLSGNRLDCNVLSTLSRARACNVLRAWVDSCGLQPPTQAQLSHVFRDLLKGQDSGRAVVCWPGSEIRRYRGALYAMASLPKPDPRELRRWTPPQPLRLTHGCLSVVPADGEGLDRVRCESGRVEVRLRRGGERCRPVGRARSQTLKKLFQEWGVPPWCRSRVPLVFVDGELAAVAGCWVCQPFEAAPDASGWKLVFCPVNKKLHFSASDPFRVARPGEE